MSTALFLAALLLAQAPAPAPTPSPDVRALFPEPEAPPEPPPPPPSENGPPGIAIGAGALQPSLVLSLIRGDIFPSTTAERPFKVRDTYFQIEPRLNFVYPVGAGGEFRAGYEPAFRRGSALQEVTASSHRLGAGIELPLGTSFLLRAADQWSKGILDVTQVDPGQEYFFRLQPFRHNVFDVNGTLSGGDTSIDGGATLSRVTIEPGSGFFSNRSQQYYGGISRSLAATLRLRLGYTRERIPRPIDRPEVESRANIYTLSLDGTIAPLLDGQISAGYRDQKTPNAGAGGRSFKGLVVAGRLEKEFTRSTRLALWGSRDTRVDLLRRNGLYATTGGQPEIALPTTSAFEENAFYVAKAFNSELQFELPLQLTARAAAQWQNNEYRTVAPAIGKPRADDFFGWALGFGRSLTRHAWVRIDYRRDRRDSNIDVFDVRTEALLVQLGFGFQGSRGRPKFSGGSESQD